MELFEVFSETGESIGLRPRDEVHREGLWHKSAHVFVFDSSGRLLLQQRVCDKDLYPDLWDYSVGEHTQPGESHEQTARRGLFEELGITSAKLWRLGATRSIVLEGPQFMDSEIQQAYRCVHDGDVKPDPTEVSGVEWWALEDLSEWVARSPDEFTPWFVRDLKAFNWLF